MEAIAGLSSLLLVEFYSKIDIFLLIAVRLLGFFLVLPILSGSTLPSIAKVILTVSITYIVFATGIVTTVGYYDNVFGYVLLIIKELFVGFTIAFVVYVFFSVFYFAGQLIDFQLGYSMVNVFDPLLQTQVPVVGNLLYFFMGVFLVQSGGLNAFIEAICYSYKTIPIGGGSIIENKELLRYLISIMPQYFIIGMKIAMPIVGSILIIDVALGLLVKAVPQMNVFIVGMPIKLLAGLVILFCVIPSFTTMYDYVYTMSYKALMQVMGGLTP